MVVSNGLMAKTVTTHSISLGRNFTLFCKKQEPLQVEELYTQKLSICANKIKFCLVTKILPTQTKYTKEQRMQSDC